MQFPIFKTKSKGLGANARAGDELRSSSRFANAHVFDLNSPKERTAYFNCKAGAEIKKLRDYLNKGNTFIAYLLGKKSSGKGTYAKMLAEIVAPAKIEHFSVGDMIRNVDAELKDRKKKKELVQFLEKNYRGWSTTKELISLLEKRSVKALLPTDLILTLTKREIERRPKKAIFIDGFPRDLDQINFSLFFRDLVGHRQDPDLFVLINVPKNVIDERIKSRRVCPKCQTSRNLKLLPTSKVGYDKKKKEFYLLCDNPACQEIKLVPKEGDEFGIKPIEKRLEKDEKLIFQTFSLYGIPKVFLRNAIPKAKARECVDNYELTPEYYYVWNEKLQKAEVKEKTWVVMDDEGKPSYSLLPPPIVVSLIKQLTDILKL